MKKRFTIPKVCILFSGLLLVAGTALAIGYIKSVKSVKNDFKTAKINIAVQENENSNTNPAPAETTLTWSADPDGSTYTSVKKVTVYNNDNGSNSAQAFIRVCIVPHWTMQTSDNTEIDITNISGISEFGSFVKDIENNSYTMGDVTFNLAEDWADNWIYAADGYFYCRSSIAPGASTPTLLESVSVSADTYNNNILSNVNLRVDILADSIQTEGQDSREISALEERWGSPEELGITVDGSEELPVLTEYPPEGGDQNG